MASRFRNDEVFRPLFKVLDFSKKGCKRDAKKGCAPRQTLVLRGGFWGIHFIANSQLVNGEHASFSGLESEDIWTFFLKYCSYHA